MEAGNCSLRRSLLEPVDVPSVFVHKQKDNRDRYLNISSVVEVSGGSCCLDVVDTVTEAEQILKQQTSNPFAVQDSKLLTASC